MTTSEFKAFIQERVNKLLSENKHFTGWDGIPIEMDTRDFAIIATMDEPVEDIKAEAKYALEDGQIDEIDYNRIMWYLENIKPTAIKSFPVHMNEDGVSAPTQENKNQEIYDEIDMMMRPTDDSLTTSEINDIANNYNVDFETVLGIMQNYLSDRNNLIADELKSGVEDALQILESEGNTNPSFGELIQKLKTSFEFQYNHTPEEIKSEFDKQTKDPNQLTLFESFRRLVRKTLNEYGFESNINNTEQDSEEEIEKELARYNIDKNKLKKDNTYNSIENDKIVDFQKENINNENYLEPSQINEILKGYLEAALWTEEERLKDDYDENFGGHEEDNESDGESTEIDKLIRIQSDLNKKSFESFVTDDLEDNSKIQAYLDIKSFLKNAGSQAVNEAINENGTFKLGMDIWLTRNGHGAGFFDHNYMFEEELMNAAKALKEVDLYITDNVKIAFSNSH